jgi:hypothetical protein
LYIDALREFCEYFSRAPHDGIVPPEQLHIVLHYMDIVVSLVERVGHYLVVRVVKPAYLAVAGNVISGAEHQANMRFFIGDCLESPNNLRFIACIVNNENVIVYRHANDRVYCILEVMRKLVSDDYM